jgi:capsule polysaccharide export protein KpsE/RkpR
MMQSSRKIDTFVFEAPASQPATGSSPGEKPANESVVPKLRLLWSQRQFLWRCCLVGLLVSLLIAFLIPAEYKTTVRLMPPDSQSSNGLALIASLAGQNGGGLSAIASDILGVKTTGALFVAVLRSRTIEDQIVQRFDLKKVYWKRSLETARKRLESNTDISEERKSGVTTLTVEDHDPKRAAGIAAAYVDELNSVLAQVNTSAAHRERVFLEGRLNSIKVELESAEKDFSQFASKNATLDISTQGKAMVEGAASLQGELIAAESELEGLKQIYSDQNVRVRSLQARVKELRNQQSKLGGKYSGGSDNDISLGDAFPTLRQLPILGVPYADKFRQLKVDEAVFEILTKQYELARVQEAKEIPSVKVLDAPEVPENRSFPPRLLIIFSGAVCALIIAAIWVLARFRWREMDPQDPGVLLTQEVFETMRAGMSRTFARSRLGDEQANGSGAMGDKGRTSSRI